MGVDVAAFASFFLLMMSLRQICHCTSSGSREGLDVAFLDFKNLGKALASLFAAF